MECFLYVLQVDLEVGTEAMKAIMTIHKKQLVRGSLFTLIHFKALQFTIAHFSSCGFPYIVSFSHPFLGAFFL
jgi:hypothetical protein